MSVQMRPRINFRFPSTIALLSAQVQDNQKETEWANGLTAGITQYFYCTYTIIFNDNHWLQRVIFYISSSKHKSQWGNCFAVYSVFINTPTSYYRMSGQSWYNLSPLLSKQAVALQNYFPFHRHMEVHCELLVHAADILLNFKRVR